MSAMEPLPDDLVDALLDAMPVARLALSDQDGAPEALPIVFGRAAGCAWSPIDGKPKGPVKRLGRIARLQRAPDIMLVLDHYAEDWSELWWLRLKGRAEVVVGTHPDWAAAVHALQAKYPQYRTVPMFKDEPTLIRMHWHTVGWWAAAGRTGIEGWLGAAARRAAAAQAMLDGRPASAAATQATESLL